jgi:N-acetylmuramoyl-L-alanine amidase
MGFITNAAEAAAMNNDPASYAQGIYNGIVSYFS